MAYFRIIYVQDHSLPFWIVIIKWSSMKWSEVWSASVIMVCHCSADIYFVREMEEEGSICLFLNREILRSKPISDAEMSAAEIFCMWSTSSLLIPLFSAPLLWPRYLQTRPHFDLSYTPVKFGDCIVSGFEAETNWCHVNFEKIPKMTSVVRISFDSGCLQDHILPWWHTQ